MNGNFLVVHLESIEYLLLSWCTICGKIATLLFHMAHPQFKGKLLNQASCSSSDYYPQKFWLTIVYNFPQATLPQGQQIGTLAYMKLKRKLSILWCLSYLELRFFLINYDVSWLTITMLGGQQYHKWVRTTLSSSQFQASLGSRLGYRVFGQVYVLGYVRGYLEKFRF